MRRTLVKLLERNLRRDPLDGPVVDVQDAVLAQDMEWVLSQAARPPSAVATAVAASGVDALAAHPAPSA